MRMPRTLPHTRDGANANRIATRHPRRRPHPNGRRRIALSGLAGYGAARLLSWWRRA